MPAAQANREQQADFVPEVPRLAVNNQIRLEYYFRSANLLVRQADVYRRNRDERQLYTMLMRFASLVVETIPDHKDFRQDKSLPEYSRLRTLLASRLFMELEAVKRSLRLLGTETSAPFPQQESHTPDTTQLTTSSLPQLDWGALSGQSVGAPIRADQVLAPTTRSLDLLSGDLPSQPEQTALPTFDAASFSGYGPASEDIRSRHALLPVTAVRRRPAVQQSAGQSLPYPSFDSLSVPAIAYGSDQQHANGNAAAANLQHLSLMDAQPSAPPSSAQLEDLLTPSPQVELQLGPQEMPVHTRPALSGLSASRHDCSLPEPQPPPPATADTAGDVSSQRHEVREVHVSMALMEDFMRYALANTRRSIESCGILAGSLDSKRGLFTISTLIVPKQEGSSDMVSALNEEEIFDAQDKRSLYPLGWIHTHPSQTCFLSSIDIHTQCGYQTMLDEAVAIVMAPRDSRNRCGIFRLSSPGGLKLVQKCPQRGFHMHPPTETGQPIYELCGHVFLNPRIQHETIDLR